jgi:hypothetical protein
VKKEIYDSVKKSGMLYELFPEATGNFEEDCDYVFLKECVYKRERNQRFIDVFDTFGDDYVF